MQTDFSFNQTKYIEFIKGIRDRCGKDKIFLFADNCRVHKTPLVLEEMKKLDIEPVWNVPYHYEFNASCERFFSMLK